MKKKPKITAKKLSPAEIADLKAKHEALFTGAEVEQRPDPIIRKNATAETTTAPATAPLMTRLSRKLAEARSIEDDSPHVIVVARAGTGKTTTLIEGIKPLFGLESTLTPSPQQRAVWDAIALSKGKAKTCCFVAFNKSIADELKSRVPAGCDAMTMHSMGFRAILKAFPELRGRELNRNRTADVLAKILGHEDRFRLREKDLVLMSAVEQIASLCKLNLVGPWDGVNSVRGDETNWGQAISNLASHYDVDLDGSRDRVVELVPRVLELLRVPSNGYMIDYDDMIWLAVVLRLPLTRYDILLVDEFQDTNRCQQALAKRAGKRLILCGDDRQAIYGFAGADSESMERMAKELGGWADFERYMREMGNDLTDFTKNQLRDRFAEYCQAPLKCITLPLTVTRRCGKAIVEEAKRIVPDFEAHSDNPEGKISYARYE